MYSAVKIKTPVASTTGVVFYALSYANALKLLA